MSEVITYIRMPSYLRQWFIHRHGGLLPVSLKRGSIESKLLQRAATLPPDGYIPAPRQEDEVAVCLPSTKFHDPRTYSYVSPRGKAAIVSLIKNDFDIDCWEFLHDFGKIGQQQKDLIYLFMEQRGIREDGSTWDAIAKIYQRLRKNYLTKMSKKYSTTSRAEKQESEKEE